MRRKYRLINLLQSTCLFIASVLIQKNSLAQSFQSGFSLGLNTSQVTGDNLSGFNKPGPTFGAFVNRTFENDFTIGFEITYLSKGSRKNLNPKDSIPTFYSLNIHYIEIPLNFIWKGNDRLKFEMGPSIGIYLGHREADEFGDLKNEYSTREQFKPIDISAQAGVYYKINSNWSFNLRIANSVMAVRNHDLQTKFRLNRGQYNTCVMGRMIYTFKR
jgi:hypothetical protein